MQFSDPPGPRACGLEGALRRGEFRASLSAPRSPLAGIPRFHDWLKLGGLESKGKAQPTGPGSRLAQNTPARHTVPSDRLLGLICKK